MARLATDGGAGDVSQLDAIRQKMSLGVMPTVDELALLNQSVTGAAAPSVAERAAAKFAAGEMPSVEEIAALQAEQTGAAMPDDAGMAAAKFRAGEMPSIAEIAALNSQVTGNAPASAADLKAATDTAGQNNGPGKAWSWNGMEFTRPEMPSDGKTYSWDDNLGWVLSASGNAGGTGTGGGTGGSGGTGAGGNGTGGTGTGGMSKDEVDAAIAAAVAAALAGVPKGITKADMDSAIADALRKQKEEYDAQAEAAKNADRKSAYEIMKSRFAQYGLKELGDAIEGIYKGSYMDKSGKMVSVDVPTSADSFYLELLNTKPYYDRFGKVNEDRVSNGFTALDEKTILNLEDDYQKVMQAYNMPAGFYDNYTDFQTFLKYDKSKSEIADDLQAFSDFTDKQLAKNPEIFASLQTYYGITPQAVTASYADPEKGQQVLNQIAGKNKNAAAALISGLATDAAATATQFGAADLTYQQQKQGYSQVAFDVATTGKLAQIYGENYGQTEAIAREFGANAQAKQKAERIRQTSLSQFAGTSGVGRTALGRRTGGMQ